MSNNNLNVFLSGEIHTDWRGEIIDQSKNQNLSLTTGTIFSQLIWSL